MLRPYKKVVELIKRRDDISTIDILRRSLSAIRGRIIACILRKEVVSDWKLPPYISAFKDRPTYCKYE